MKNINFRLFVAILGSFLFLNSVAFSQEKASTNSSQLDVVLPNYQYEFVPDFTYEEVNERIQKMDLEMEFELNEQVFSYIQFFTIRNRNWIKMVLARKEQYFPMYEETMKNHGMPVEIQNLSIIESFEISVFTASFIYNFEVAGITLYQLNHLSQGFLWKIFLENFYFCFQAMITFLL